MSKTLRLVPEAVRAIKRNPPSRTRLERMLNGYDSKDMPTSEEVRWLASLALQAMGYTFEGPDAPRAGH